MLIGFFEHLRKYRVPVSIRELLDVLTIFNKRLVFADQDEFYFMSRLALVKDEKYYDRFDQAFASYFSGLDDWIGLFDEEEELLREELLRHVRESGDREVAEALERYTEVVREIREQRERTVDDEQGREEGDGTGEGHGDDAGEGGESGKQGEGDEGEEGEGDNGEKGEGDEGKEGEGDDG
ncbi:MAG: hypothetical protein JJ956_13835, partial [Pseudomonadales bacterium]|nr:hypothetical protein [Pseudomonadales bacterium]